MIKLVTKSLMVSAVIGCLIHLPVAARSVLETGLQHYNRGNFHHAAIFLSEAASEQPNNALIHYYLANSYVHLNLHEQSVCEYQIGSRLDPQGKVGQYCRQALQSFSKLSLSNPGSLEPRATADGAQSTLKFSEPMGMVTGRGHVIRTESLIRRQANYEKEKHRFIGESWASGMVNQAEYEARRIHEEAKLEIARAMEGEAVVVGPGKIVMNYNPEMARAKAEHIRRCAEESAVRARQHAERKASQYRQWSKERQYALDEVVANLESQLESPVGRSGVKLQPIGTDLYVRYYGHTRSNNEMPDTHQSVLRIVEQGAQPNQIESGDSGQQLSLPPVRRAQRRVQGKVLRYPQQ